VGGIGYVLDRMLASANRSCFRRCPSGPAGICQQNCVGNKWLMNFLWTVVIFVEFSLQEANV